MAQSTAQAGTDLPAGWSASMRAFLNPIDSDKVARAGLADDIANYVLLGEPAAILQEVAGEACVAHALGVSGSGLRPKFLDVMAVYAPFHTLPTDVALRWALVLEASAAAFSQPLCSIDYPGGIHWPEILMMNAANRDLSTWSSDPPQVRYLTAVQVEAMLVAAGLDPAMLLRGAFTVPFNSASWMDRSPLLTGLLGYPAYLHKHLEVVRPMLLAPAVALRLQMLTLMQAAEGATVAALAPELCALATASSKLVRAAAAPVIGRGGAAVHAPLRALASTGKPEQRLHALRLLWPLADTPLQESLRALAGADKAASVQALLQEWDRSDAPQESSDVARDYTLPQIDWDAGAGEAVDQALHALRQAIDDKFDGSRKGIPRLTDADFQCLRQFVASREPRAEVWHADRAFHLGDIVDQFAARPGLPPLVLLKITTFLASSRSGKGLAHMTVSALNAMHSATGQPSLLELQQMLEPMGYTADDVLYACCVSWSALARHWPDQAVFPFYMHHIDLLNQYLASSTATDYNFLRTELYRAVAMLPRLPSKTVDILFDLALGSVKSERAAAQDALAGYADRGARIAAALASGKGEVRTLAAQWLARIDQRDALPALEKAVAKEKNDVAKGAMLDTLLKFGRPVELYFDRAALLKEAEAVLAKGVPKEIDWFPWAAMPPVCWADSGAPVDGGVLRSLLVQACKQKSPEPNAVLRKLCAMFAPLERERFGQFVLEAWIAQDTIPISREVAEHSARANAENMYGMLQQMPHLFQGSALVGRSLDEIAASYLPGLLVHPVGSAIASKGVLAVAAACAGERAAATAGRYLKQFYGTRAAHGRALIAMLAWVEHPAATQLVLSVGNRFRTKSFQEEATRQVEALAERKGWTIAELADRTIPTARLDEAGELELDCGARRFTVRLQPDFKVELFNQEGNKVAALPEPRIDDDAALAKAAKQTLSEVKKEIKTIVKAQSERLYEALCIERDWAFDEWDRYLMRHPVVRHLAQRLVWVRYEDGAVAASFRPLDDGTLSDPDDNDVTMPADARVRIAHDSIMERSVCDAWVQHMIDYETLPLFQQFGKGHYALPADQEKAASIKDFEGYMIAAFALRARALQLGYARGPNGDGGWFSTYEKRFTTLGLVARIAFSGNEMPEKDRPVALTSLTFGGNGGDVVLAKLPAVLLSECYNDMRMIAEAGSGFDAA